MHSTLVTAVTLAVQPDMWVGQDERHRGVYVLKMQMHRASAGPCGCVTHCVGPVADVPFQPLVCLGIGLGLTEER